MPGITDVAGLLVGHAKNDTALTGCTVILTMGGAVAGVDVRGSAPGTRETDLMRPCNLVERVHAIVLTGGSAYGLDAACGVMQFLEERSVGFDTGFGVVPIVGAAVIFDLGIGNPRIRPDRQMGYAACTAASANPSEEGNVGVGLGATVGKMHGPACAMKGGLGTWAIRLHGKAGDAPVAVGAIVVANAVGDVVDPDSGQVVAGAYDRKARRFVRSTAEPEPVRGEHGIAGSSGRFRFAWNTTLAVVATDARLDKEGVSKVAQMAHDGFARVIRPVHTMYDGDTVFALSTGDRAFTRDKAAGITALGAAAADVVATAVMRAVKAATAAGGVPAARDIEGAATGSND